MGSTTFVNGVTPIVAEWLNDINNAVYNNTTFIAVEGQTIFNGLTNCLHGHTQVFINGLFQEPNVSYIATDSNTITFTEGLSLGDHVLFKGL